MASEKRVTTVQALEHGLEILAVVSTAPQGMGITDLSRQLGLAKGSISRLVATLVQQGFLVRGAQSTKYRLSTEVWALGNKAVAGLDLRDVARPVMEDLNAATHETVHITILTDSGEMVFLDKVDSPRAVRPNVQLGAPHPAYCTANGKAVLAFLPKPRVSDLLNGNLRKYTSTTNTRKSELQAHLEGVRRQGFAVNHGEYREDLSGVAAPVFDHTGRVIASLGISFPTSRSSASLIAVLAPMVAKGASELSMSLGQHRDDGDKQVAPEPATGLPRRLGRESSKRLKSGAVRPREVDAEDLA